jgi:hypothetical protein
MRVTEHTNLSRTFELLGYRIFEYIEDHRNMIHVRYPDRNSYSSPVLVRCGEGRCFLVRDDQARKELRPIPIKMKGQAEIR